MSDAESAFPTSDAAIDLYTWTTPNGRKVSILLEELGVSYSAHAIDIGKDQQFSPDFLAIAPNNKIPAIKDNETGVALMESGAILLYLAEKYGKFRGEGVDGRARVNEWLMWQMGGFGPILGQCHHFLQFNPGKAPYAEERFSGEAQRLYRVLDGRLQGRDFVADEYSIADMAIWPWASRFEWQRVDLGDFPNVRKWYLRMLEREGVQKGYQVPKNMGDIPAP